jgi:hypothetical protein
MQVDIEIELAELPAEFRAEIGDFVKSALNQHSGPHYWKVEQVKHSQISVQNLQVHRRTIRQTLCIVLLSYTLKGLHFARASWAITSFCPITELQRYNHGPLSHRRTIEALRGHLVFRQGTRRS